MGPLGMGEIVVIFVLALLIFGPKKLPELGKTFGKGMAEFKRASNELKSTFQREMDNIERETSDVKNLATDVSKDIDKSYYDDGEEDYHDAYDYDDGVKSTTSSNSTTTNGTALMADAANADPTNEASPSPEGSDSAAEAATETPSEDSSSEGASEVAEVSPPPLETDVGASEPKPA